MAPASLKYEIGLIRRRIYGVINWGTAAPSLASVSKGKAIRTFSASAWARASFLSAIPFAASEVSALLQFIQRLDFGRRAHLLLQIPFASQAGGSLCIAPVEAARLAPLCNAGSLLNSFSSSFSHRHFANFQRFASGYAFGQ